MQLKNRQGDGGGEKPATLDSFQACAERVLAENRRRRERIPADFYSLMRPANLFIQTQRKRALLSVLRRQNILTLRGLRILEVGCGAGGWLLEFLAWGAVPELLAGIELDPHEITEAFRRLPSADLRVGNAALLPWPDGHFDIVLQATVFSSIFDSDFKRAIAREMLRVTRPGGVILWYDSRFNSPWNRQFRAIGVREIKTLFPESAFDLRRVTLLPPLARWLVSLSWAAALAFETILMLRTHILGCIRPRKGAVKDCIMKKQVLLRAAKAKEVSLQTVSYARMRAADSRGVAALHSLCFPDYFLTGLGEHILALYYSHYDERAESICYVARTSSRRVVGFVAGSLSYSRFLRSFYRARFLSLALAIGRAFFLSADLRQKIWQRTPHIREAIRSRLRLTGPREDSGATEADPGTAVLASVAVDPEFRGTDVAGDLFRLFEQHARKLRAVRLELSVRKSNARAVAFYKNAGWRAAGHEGRNLVFEKML